MIQSSASPIRWGFFVVGGLIAAFVASAFPVPLLWYEPLGRAFSFGAAPHALAADYFGRVLLMLGGSVVGLSAGVIVERKVTSPAVRARIVLGCAAAATLQLAFTVALYGVTLWNRPARPEPLPPGYVAR